MIKTFFLTVVIIISSLILSCSHDTISGTMNSDKTENILLSKKTVYLAVGKNDSISASVLPDGPAKTDLIWHVYNPDVASVENGKIKGLSCGKTKIAVSIDEITEEADIIVRNLEKNRLRIHFKTIENTPESYKKYGIVLIGEALPGTYEGYSYKINDTIYDYRNFLQFKNTDSFGMYTDISIQDDKNLSACILKNTDIFDYFSDASLLQEIDLLSYNEIWFTEGINKFFLSEPVNGLTGLNISGENKIVTAGDTIDMQLKAIPSTVSLTKVNWQTSNQFVARVDSVGKVTAISTGTVVISAYSGGLVAHKTISIVPAISNAFVRIHYCRYKGDYENWTIVTLDSVFSFNDFDVYGAYVDIPSTNELKFTLKTDFETALNYSGSDIKQNELWILQGKPDVLTSRPSMDIGAFKIANSWSDKIYQNGLNWENKIDGFFYMSYDALKKSESYAYYISVKQPYQPRMLAVFNVEGNFRGDFWISFGAGDTASPKKIKNFLGYPFLTYGNIYESKFPATNIVFDITDLLPLNTEDVFMEIKDGAFNRTLKVNSFSIEIYDEYSSEPTQIISDSGLPAFTIDGSTTRFVIEDLTITENSMLAKEKNSKPFEISSRPLSSSDLNGYIPCPARMPVNQFTELANSGKIKILDKVIAGNNCLAKSMMENRVDNSTSPHFPPVGSQEFKGSCTAWAIGYYMATYNIARKNNWDLSGARWENGLISEGYRDKIMSPDFLYNLINEGTDNGSYGYFASLVLQDIGIASMNTAPIIYDNVKEWPTEQAFREAPLNRHDKSSFFYCPIKTDLDIENIKNLIKAGELVTVAIQAYNIKLTENDTYIQQNAGINLDHLVTIVGFDNNWTTESTE